MELKEINRLLGELVQAKVEAEEAAAVSREGGKRVEALETELARQLVTWLTTVRTLLPRWRFTQAVDEAEEAASHRRMQK